MSIFQRILQEEHEKKIRQDNAFATVRALADDERRAVLARLIDAEEASVEAATSEPIASSEPTAPPSPPVDSSTYIEKAIAFVRLHPEGVRTKVVGKNIGQKMPNVDGTLRLGLKRGVLERRDGKWFFVGQPVTKPPSSKKTLRDMVLEVLVNEKRPLGAAEIFQCINKGRPNTNRGSVDAEVNRMKRDHLLVNAGSGPRGGLYALATGGEPPINIG